MKTKKLIHNTKISHSFFLRKNTKSATVFLAIRIKGKCRKVNTGIEILPTQWTAQKSIKGDTSKNLALQELKTKVQEAIHELRNHPSPTIETVLAQLEGIKIAQENPTFASLIDTFQQFAETNPDSRPRTLQYLRGASRNIKLFFVAMYQNEDVTVLEIESKKLAKDLIFYFKQIRKVGANYLNKQLAYFVRVLNYATEEGVIDSNPLQNFKLPKRKKPEPPISLTAEEMERLKSYPFFDSLQGAVDCFLFQCATGVSYSDFINLTSQNIERDNEGVLWLKGKRVKTDTPYVIPLLPLAQEILAKYGGKPENMPKLLNQVYNKQLKAIAQLVGIDKYLTVHIARKTFAMQMLNDNAIPLETVAVMLGHTNTRITQAHYCQVNQARVKHDTAKLWQVLPKQTPKIITSLS